MAGPQHEATEHSKPGTATRDRSAAPCTARLHALEPDDTVYELPPMAGELTIGVFGPLRKKDDHARLRSCLCLLSFLPKDVVDRQRERIEMLSGGSMCAVLPSSGVCGHARQCRRPSSRRKGPALSHSKLYSAVERKCKVTTVTGKPPLPVSSLSAGGAICSADSQGGSEGVRLQTCSRTAYGRTAPAQGALSPASLPQAWAGIGGRPSKPYCGGPKRNAARHR